MFTSIRDFAIAALAASFLAVTPVAALAAPPDDPPTVVEGGSRPAPLAEHIPPAPSRGLVWVPGRWDHHVFANEWVWEPGYYETAGGVVAGPGVVVTHPVYVRPVFVHPYWHPWHRVVWRRW